MFLARSVVWQLAALVLLGLVTAPAALAADWFDDFNDGSTTAPPVAWLEDLGGSGLFPGDYNASSGDYVLTPQADGGPDSIMLSLVASDSFTDVHVRTQGIVMPDPNDPVNNSGGNLVVLGRVDIGTVSGYLAYVDVSGNLNIQISLGGSTADIGETFDLDINAGEEIILELNIVGSDLTAFAWQPGQAKPTTPQAFATDPTFTAGVSGIAYAEDDDNTFGIFRYVASQATPFVDVLPGDYNLDGQVDAGDYPVWRDTLNTQETYDVWAANFGNSGAGSGGAAAVPEPAGLAWILLALSGAAACVRSRRLGSR